MYFICQILIVIDNRFLKIKNETAFYKEKVNIAYMSDVRPSDSVRAVKEEIERLVGVPAEQQRLVYYACCQAGLQTRHHCRFLKMGDEKTVKKFRIKPDHFITLVDPASQVNIPPKAPYVYTYYPHLQKP